MSYVVTLEELNQFNKNCREELSYGKLLTKEQMYELETTSYEIAQESRVTTKAMYFAILYATLKQMSGYLTTAYEKGINEKF